MPTDRDPEFPGGSDDPTRAGDPVDPTVVRDPVDTAHAQGAAPAAGMGAVDRAGAPMSEEPRRRDPRGDDRNTAGWLWALLAAAVIGIVLFALLGDDDGDDAVGTVDQPTDTAAPETSVEDTATQGTTPETAAPEDAPAAADDTTASTTTAAPDDGAGTAGEPGTVTAADGTDLLTLVQGDAGDADRLAPYAGTEVTGESVEVLEVVEGQGAWIGTDDERRLFARTTDGLSVEAGDRISFDGSLEANPSEGADDAIEIPEDQGAEQLRRQGHHIQIGELTQT